MRKIPKKAKVTEPKRIVVKIDPSELRSGIMLPKINYEVVATVETDEAFNGMVLPLPRVLVYFLNRKELMIFATIMEETNENGECGLTVKEIAKRIKTSIPTVSNSLYTIRRMGLLLEKGNGNRGAGRIRMLNWQTIQHLNDLTENEDPGIYSRIRKATRKTDILNLTKEDIKAAYDNQVCDPDDDLAEMEEYD